MSVADALASLYGRAPLALYSPNRPYLFAHLGNLDGNDLLYYPGPTNDLRYRVPLGDVDAVVADGLITR